MTLARLSSTVKVIGQSQGLGLHYFTYLTPSSVTRTVCAVLPSDLINVFLLKRSFIFISIVQFICLAEIRKHKFTNINEKGSTGLEKLSPLPRVLALEAPF